jgi:hypothetical protein
MRRLDNMELFSVDPDGGDALRLTTDNGEDFDPSWSPDGASIVWTSDRGGTYDLYSMRADGSGVTPVTSSAGLDEYPDQRQTCALSGTSPLNCGETVENWIDAGEGDDVVFTGRGADVVNGGAGADVIVGGGGDDLLNGQDGNDRLQSGPAAGRDVLRGAAGLDFLAALDGAGGDTVNGGPDADGCQSDKADKRISC